MYSARNLVGSQGDGQANIEAKKTANRPGPTAHSKMAAKTIHGWRDDGSNGNVEGPNPDKHVEIDAMESGHSDSYPDPAINLTRELRPVLIMMTVYGLYYPPIDANKSLTVRLLDPRRLYCFVINLVAWFNALRYIFPLINSIRNVDVLVTLISPAVWQFQCAFGISHWFYQCNFAPRRFQAFVEHLHQVYRACPRLMISGHRRWLKHTIFLAIVIPTVTNCFNVSVFTFFAYGPIDELRNATGILFVPFGQEGKLPMLFFCFASTLPYICTISVFVLFSTLTSRVLDKFNEHFKNGISEDGKFQFSFEKVRHEHQSLAKLVATGNEIFSPYLGFIVTTSLVLVTFLLYQVTQLYNPEGELILYAIWCLICSSILAALFWFAVQIHEQAHDAENYIHDIFMCDRLEEGTSIQVMLFLAKLHGKPIALTVWNLTSITKDFVLTVFGIMASYFIIIVQTFTP